MENSGYKKNELGGRPINLVAMYVDDDMKAAIYEAAKRRNISVSRFMWETMRRELCYVPPVVPQGRLAKRETARELA